MTENEQYVQEAWERAEECPHRDGKRYCISLGGLGFTRVTVPKTTGGYAETKELAWTAARAFTEKRIEECRQLQEEITILEYMARDSREYPARIVAWKRILARLESALADLQRGLRVRPSFLRSRGC